MGKSKGARIIITLECECKNKNDPEYKSRKNGIFRYTSTKNRKNTPNRIEIQKFCRTCNCHSTFKEIK